MCAFDITDFIRTNAVFLSVEAQLRALEGKLHELEHDHWGRPLHPAFMTPDWREAIQALDDEIDRLRGEIHGPADPMAHVEFPFARNH